VKRVAMFTDGFLGLGFLFAAMAAVLAEEWIAVPGWLSALACLWMSTAWRKTSDNWQALAEEAIETLAKQGPR
jgi:hypothetical protein